MLAVKILATVWIFDVISDTYEIPSKKKQIRNTITATIITVTTLLLQLLLPLVYLVNLNIFKI